MDSKTLRRAVLVALCATAAAANTPILRVDAGRIQARVSPTLYGLMTEEINHSYDGGLYGELVSNRTFQDDPATPVHWSLVQAPASTASIDLDRNLRLGPALPVSLRFKLSAANDWAGVANDGFWGIPVRPHTLYYASFYADPGPGYTGPLTISLESSDGKTVWASAEVGPGSPSGGSIPRRSRPATSCRLPKTGSSSGPATRGRSGSRWSRYSPRPGTTGSTGIGST